MWNWTPERIAAFGSIGIAGLALVASQLPPAYSLFKSAEMTYELQQSPTISNDIGRLKFTALVRFKNNGDDFAEFQKIIAVICKIDSCQSVKFVLQANSQISVPTVPIPMAMWSSIPISSVRLFPGESQERLLEFEERLNRQETNNIRSFERRMSEVMLAAMKRMPGVAPMGGVFGFGAPNMPPSLKEADSKFFDELLQFSQERMKNISDGTYLIKISACSNGTIMSDKTISYRFTLNKEDKIEFDSQIERMTSPMIMLNSTDSPDRVKLFLESSISEPQLTIDNSDCSIYEN